MAAYRYTVKATLLDREYDSEPDVDLIKSTLTDVYGDYDVDVESVELVGDVETVEEEEEEEESDDEPEEEN